MLGLIFDATESLVAAIPEQAAAARAAAKLPLPLLLSLLDMGDL